MRKEVWGLHPDVRTATRNLVVLSLAIFLASASWFQVMPFLPLFLQEMGLKDNLVQWSGVVFGCQSLASIVALPFWGKLGDRYGQKPMTVRAGVCLTAIYFGMSVCRSPLQLAVLRFANGALTGFIPGAIALVATGTPSSRAPRAVATAQTASAVGQIVGPALGGGLAATFGYRGAMQASGAAVAVSTLLVALLVRENARAVSSDSTSLVEDFRLALRSPFLASMMVAVLANTFPMAALSPLLALHLGRMGQGAPEWLTGLVFSRPAGAFVLSAHRWTRLGERIGYDRAIIVGLAGAAVCAAALAAVGRIGLFAAGLFALGICLSATSPSTGALICTRVPEGFRGRAYGMQFSSVMLAGLLAPLGAAQVAAHLGIPAVFLAAALLLLAGLGAFRVLVRRWHTDTLAAGLQPIVVSDHTERGPR